MSPHRTRFKEWRWWTVALRGVAAVLFGILSLAAPGVAFMSLVILFGVYALADGILAFALASRPTLLPKSPMYLRGIVSIIAGLLALIVPDITALALLVVIASWAVLSGVFEIVMAIRLRHKIEHEWLLGVEGAVAIAFGVVLLLSPLAGAIVLGLWVGAYALVLGGMMIATAFRLRSYAASHAELAA